MRAQHRLIDLRSPELGTRFKVVGGYQAPAESNIAMERVEIDGRCGITWDTLVSLNADWLRDKKIRQALIRQVYATPKDLVAKAALAGRGR